MKNIYLGTAMLAAALSMTSEAAINSTSSLLGHTPKFTEDHLDLGLESGVKPVRLRIWLKLHQPSQLAQAARARRFLSKSEIETSFKPTPAEIAKVQKYLQDNGMKNVKADASRLFVTAEGTVADAQRVFQVEMHNYLIGANVVTSNTTNPVVDSEIADKVSYVGGLTNHKMKSMLAKQMDFDTGTPIQAVPFVAGTAGNMHQTTCFTDPETHVFSTAGAPLPQASYTGNRYGSPITSPAPNLPPCGYGPSDVQAAYGVDALVEQGLDGSGQTVVIIDAFGSPTAQADATAFSAAYGLPAPVVAIYQPGGVPVVGPWNADQQGWAGETTLDVEYAHAMAPGAKIALVEALSDSDDDLAAAIAYAVENNLGNSISNSWSGLESEEDPASMALMDSVLQTAAARGMSVHFSTGDSGDSVAAVGYADVGYPSSSPYATAIGGTSLALNADHSIKFHSGWGNNGARIADGVTTPDLGAAGQNAPLAPPVSLGFIGGAGGGTSRIYPKPDYQNALPGSARMIPDIAYLADPYTGVEIIESTFDAGGNPQPGTLSLQVIGGTSLACPMFSGMWAIANQAHGSPLGQAAPLLYKLSGNAIVDVVPVGSPSNVSGFISTVAGTVMVTPLMISAPQTETAFYSAIYNSPASPYHWDVLTFGTDSTLQTAVGWDDVTGLGIPNGAQFVEELQ